MPRVPGRPWRLVLSLVLAAAALASPTAVSADRPLRFSEHAVNLFCDAFGPEGEIHLFAGTSSEFGTVAELVAWLSEVTDRPPDITGSTADVSVAEVGDGATISAAIPLIDASGAFVGDALLDATLTPNGDVETLEPFREGNRWVRTIGTIRYMDVVGTLDAPGDLPDVDLAEIGCGGDIVDISVFETQPDALVFRNDGIFVECFWETDDAFANLFVINDAFGQFAEATLITADREVFGAGEPDVLTTGEVSATIPMFDFLGETEESATVSAALNPVGDPVESRVRFQDGKQRLTEQFLAADGTISFSTGHAFSLDSDACFALEFDVHAVITDPAGPKPGGKGPSNDTPDGATPLRIGRWVNDHTGGASYDPEFPVATCPQADDAFGRTLWYTFTGTGGPVTIDTAGSDFDTVVAVYDGSLTEIACVDDVEFEPVGFTLQSAVTVNTDAGATYYVQVGGFHDLFFGGDPEFGRLRIRIG